MLLLFRKLYKGDAFSFVKFISFFGFLPFLSGIYFLHYCYSIGIVVQNNFYFYLIASVLIGLGLVIMLITAINSYKLNIKRILGSENYIKYILYLAILIRIGWIFLVDSYPTSDGSVYYQSAVDLSQGNGYLLGGVPTAYWPVGFSAFISVLFFVFGKTWFILKLFNVLLSIGILVLSYLITKLLFKSETAARIVLLLLTFYPSHIAYTSLFMSEILFTFLMLAGMYMLYRSINTNNTLLSILVGITFALACYVRPQALLVPYAILAIMLLINRFQNWKQYLSIVVKLTIALIITVTPWTIRNYGLYNEFTFISTNGGINFYMGNSPYATGTYEEVGFTTYYEEHGITPERSPEFEIKIDKMLTSGAIEFIKTHPIETFVLWIKKFIILYADDVEGIHANNWGIIPKSVKAEEFEKILNTLNESDKNVLISSYKRNPVAPNYYIKGDLSNEQIVSVSSILKAHGYTNKILAPFSILYYVFQSYYAMILVLFAVSIISNIFNKKLASHLQLYGVILYFTLIGIVFVALPRYHFSIIPIMVIASSMFLTNKLESETVK